MSAWTKLRNCRDGCEPMSVRRFTPAQHGHNGAEDGAGRLFPINTGRVGDERRLGDVEQVCRLRDELVGGLVSAQLDAALLRRRHGGTSAHHRTGFVRLLREDWAAVDWTGPESASGPVRFNAPCGP